MYGSRDAETQFTSKIHRVTMLTALRVRGLQAKCTQGMAEMEEAGLDVLGVGREMQLPGVGRSPQLPLALLASAVWGHEPADAFWYFNI